MTPPGPGARASALAGVRACARQRLQLEMKAQLALGLPGVRLSPPQDVQPMPQSVEDRHSSAYARPMTRAIALATRS